MKPTNIPAALTAVWLWASVLHSTQAAETKIFSHPKNGFSITLPADWKQIPREVLDDFSKNIATLAPNAARQHYDYGYQRASAPGWFQYPYVLIQVKNIGRVTEGELSRLPKTKTFQSALDKDAKGMDQLISNLKVGQTTHDPDKHMLWMNMSMDSAGIGRIQLVSGTHLTEKGTIGVYCYAREAEFAAWKEPFASIITSLALSPELRYKPKMTDSALGRIGQTAIVGAIAGGLAGLLFTLFKRKKPAA